MKKIFLILVIVFICGNAFAFEPVQQVQIAPAIYEVSFSTVLAHNGWVTCPTIEMRGRKAINILNTSLTDNVYLKDVSGTTVTRSTIARRLYPKQDITFGISDAIHIYVSSSTVDIVVEISELK